MAQASQNSLLLQVYQHVVLPRDVPGAEDNNLPCVIAKILDGLLAAVERLVHYAPINHVSRVQAIQTSLTRCKALNCGEEFDLDVLVQELRQLERHQALVFYVIEQNAALLIYKHYKSTDDAYLAIEAFETSATCEKVLASGGALRWTFPGRAVLIPSEVYSEGSFLKAMARFMDQARIESIKHFSATSSKAGALLPEIRDTTNPAVITTLFMTILESNGSHYSPPTLCKRVRDTVSYKDAYKPWRRSPFYLVLRVAIQRQLYRLFGPHVGRAYYKILVCIFLSGLLDQSLGSIPAEASHGLMRKLGRRLAKLEQDRNNAAFSDRTMYHSLLLATEASFEKSLSTATNFLQGRWDDLAARTQRVIKPLPYKANAVDLILKLPSCGSILDRVLRQRYASSKYLSHEPVKTIQEYERTTAKIHPFAPIASPFWTLAAFEEEKIGPCLKWPIESHPNRCIELSQMINDYITNAGSLFDEYLTLKGRFLLMLLKIWTEMDRVAVQCYPLLRRYHPGLHPSLLDVLELASREEVRDAQNIQSYLKSRCEGRDSAKISKTIFDTPSNDSFAVSYYDSSSDSEKLCALRRTIETRAKRARDVKETEWKMRSKEHDRLMQQVARTPCSYVLETSSKGKVKKKHQKGCLNHKYRRQARKMKIRVFEHPLPQSEPAIKAVIFELACPTALGSYRDATWRILATFALPKTQPDTQIPLPAIARYSELSQYSKSSRLRVSLGSSTKSHLKSHYANSTFPVTLDDICRPCGLRLDYLDSTAQIWTSWDRVPSFAAHFPLSLPPNSPYHSLDLLPENWPSSNEIVASQTKCPMDLNVHEFTAWQNLLIGTRLRWPSLLRELGTTSINFSSESTWAVISKLIHEIGHSTSGAALKDRYAVFDDTTFGGRLLDEVSHRLTAIQSNWRESVQMDILISILLKVLSFSTCSKVRARASDLLDVSCEFTWKWCTTLRAELHDASKEATVFATWASVLCKRTFQRYSDMKQLVRHETINQFFTASVYLHDNMCGQFRHLPFPLRNAIIVDLMFTYRIRFSIREAILNHQAIILSALCEIWPATDALLNLTTDFHTMPDSWWIFLTLKSSQPTRTHHVHYNYVKGDLLIDGKQSGTLPAEYHLPVVQRLFGTQNLRVLPSYLPGMSLYIARPMPYGNRVHLRFDSGHLIVRTVYKSHTLQYISPEIFHNGTDYDLPCDLIDDCYHWLNLDTGELEVRKNYVWKSKVNNWLLSLRNRRAVKRKSVLVDPHSALARRIASNFQNFEYSHHLTITQQPSRLAVEMKRLELNFFVNPSGLLKCRQLHAVVTTEQNVGTWVGLESKLMLRSIRNRRQHIVLVPEGPFQYIKNGSHVKIIIENSGTYLRFEINNVLKRIDCAAEPRLLYTRTLWHAYTSYFLPDRLTGRSGLEEALNYLQSGSHMPWEPLHARHLNILEDIAKLSPHRVYYPPHKKRMEVVSWNPDLTISMQDDRYRELIRKIYQRSSQLSVLRGAKGAPDLPAWLSYDTHLAARAMSRSYLTESGQDENYQARDGCSVTLEEKNVAAISGLLARWPSTLRNTTRLASLLERFPLIRGHVGYFEEVQISSLLSADLGSSWGAIAQTAQKSKYEDRFSLMFLFAPLAYSADANMALLRVLVSFALLPDLKTVQAPEWISYLHFRSAERPTPEDLACIMYPARYLLPMNPSLNHTKQQSKRDQSRHEDAIQCTLVKVAESLLQKYWPINITPYPNLMDADVRRTFEGFDGVNFDMDKLSKLLITDWTRLVRNYEYSSYIRDVQTALDRASRTVSLQSESPQNTIETSPNKLTYDVSTYAFRASTMCRVTLKHLLQNPSNLSLYSQSPINKDATTRVMKVLAPRSGTLNGQQKKLASIVSTLQASSLPMRKTYAAELQQSVDALMDHIASPTFALSPPSLTYVDTQIRSTHIACDSQLRKICKALEAGNRGARWLRYAGLWPILTPCSLLAELNSAIGTAFPAGLKEALVTFGIKVTQHQRLLRIEDAILRKREQQLRDELSNTGHVNWDPLEYTDWLLLEIDGNVMLRSEQVEVAHAMISPSTGNNSIVQLLMGKGKTSCILPMVAAVLADARQLLRVVVPRPLLLQSAQVLQSKLGGILNREILHIPFSRKTTTTQPVLKTFDDLHKAIMRSHGVLLALPEHILSFKLSSIQRLCDKKEKEASIMINIQEWLDIYARDILDECDVSLSVRTQLVYPSGSQITVDGHPLRWQTLEALLHMQRCHLPELVRQYPRSIEVVQRASSDYPLIFFLRSDAEAYLIARLVEDISNGHLSTLPCAEVSVSVRQDIQTYISVLDVPLDVVDRIYEWCREKSHLKLVLYHLRGMLVHGIFLLAQKKRWNVQYGLHPNRDPVAVPYHAKGVPSATSEWGHPDIAILLTCLSFYFQGLDLAQLKQAFEQLLKSDEPSVEYSKWISEDLPESLRAHNAINVDDCSQLRQLHFHLRCNVRLLDFYMNNFVFPRHAKQFDTKLQASGWDLVHYNPLQKANCKTTGFSGTNDCRHQLPMTIKQEHLPQLAHTNAEVLYYLLQERNRRYVLAVSSKGRRLSEIELLETLQQQSIRVLIDAGAQILEHKNRDLVVQWLKIDYHAAAAVYFDDDHRAWIQYRNGSKIPLVASPYAENLDDCLVYLDESHCRGTDLKLPPFIMAALTLGPHITKDSLAQAAMRLRLLGQSQSVTFFSPPEVHQSILHLVKKDESYNPDSSDVVRWLLEQSCKAIEQLEPLYCNQGQIYLAQAQVKNINPCSVSPGSKKRNRYLSVLQTKELRTLEQLYAPRTTYCAPDFHLVSLAHPWREFGLALQKRKKLSRDRSIGINSSALEEVEQEREIENEAELVRDLQAPFHYKPVDIYALHPHIKSLAETGMLIPHSPACVSVFDALRMTALGQKFIIKLARTEGLYVSMQFIHTVDTKTPNDNFLRSPQWVLWSSRAQRAVIVSPEEADALILILRRHTCVPAQAHLAVYAAPVTRRMLCFNDLTYHAIPPFPPGFKAPNWLKIELGILAGRLYFEYDEYSELISYLNAAETNDDTLSKAFADKPLTFLHEWLAIVRKGQDFEHTPMGFVTTGKPLNADHPFFQVGRPTAVMDDVGNSFARIEEDDGSEHTDNYDDDQDDDEDEPFEDNEPLVVDENL